VKSPAEAHFSQRVHSELKDEEVVVVVLRLIEKRPAQCRAWPLAGEGTRRPARIQAEQAPACANVCWIGQVKKKVLLARALSKKLE
jgi:hypothetical protein